MRPLLLVFAVIFSTHASSRRIAGATRPLELAVDTAATVFRHLTSDHSRDLLVAHVGSMAMEHVYAHTSQVEVGYGEATKCFAIITFGELQHTLSYHRVHRPHGGVSFVSLKQFLTNTASTLAPRTFWSQEFMAIRARVATRHCIEPSAVTRKDSVVSVLTREDSGLSVVTRNDSVVSVVTRRDSALSLVTRILHDELSQ